MSWVSVRASTGRFKAQEMNQSFTVEEKQRLEAGAWALEVHSGGAYFCLGEETYDVFLNDEVFMQNIPAKVWMFNIGGYPLVYETVSW